MKDRGPNGPLSIGHVNYQAHSRTSYNNSSRNRRSILFHLGDFVVRDSDPDRLDLAALENTPGEGPESTDSHF